MLNSILYHDLPKIKSIYKAYFKVDIGNIKELCRAVQIRHDIVHRNGKDKDGNELEITEEIVRKLLNDVNVMIQNIGNQLNI